VPYIRVDRVNYSDGSHGENFRELGYNDPWPTAPDGTGHSLHRVIDGNYGNDVANWTTAAPTPAGGAQGTTNVELNIDNLWMYQNLPDKILSNLTAEVLITNDPLSNSSYTYNWEFILPDDVTIAPTTTNGGGAADPCCTFAAPDCDQPGGLSDSGQTFTVRVTVTGADFGNSAQAEALFGIALLGDVNNDSFVNVTDRIIMNAFWQTGSAEPFTFRDCDIDCNGYVNVVDRIIANSIWQGTLGQNSVSNPCPLRPGQPVSRWKFDEGSGGTAYDSAGGNDGTIYGATWTTGQIGGALSFDGVDDHVDVDALEVNTGAGAHNTVTFWMYWEGGDNQMPFGWQESYDLWFKDNFFGFNTGQGNIYGISSDGLDGKWVHVGAVFYNGVPTSANNKLYINGAVQDIVPCFGDTSISRSVTSSARISGWRVNSSYMFGGIIDEVRIYDRALSAEEVQLVYQQGLFRAFRPEPSDGATDVDPNTVLSWTPGIYAASHDVYFGTDFDNVNDATTSSSEYKGNQEESSYWPGPLELGTTYYWRIDDIMNINSLWKGNVWRFRIEGQGLLSWWKFDEGSGSTAYDSTGSNDGTIHGATWTTGQIGGGLSFDGVDDYVDVGNLGLSSEFTVMGWMYYYVQALDEPIFGSDSPGEGTRISLRSNAFEVWPDGVSWEDRGEVAFDPVSAGIWHHLAGVYNGSQIEVFVDGISMGTHSVSSGALDPNPNNYIGGHGSENWYMDGLIDNVRIYDKALSAEEVWQLYQVGLN
jgi:hypothetical protein